MLSPHLPSQSPTPPPRIHENPKPLTSQLLLFVERYVHRGLQHLRRLATQRVEEPAAQSSDAEAQKCFFGVGLGCYYGDLPLSFAAATGAAYWRALLCADLVEAPPTHWWLPCGMPYKALPRLPFFPFKGGFSTWSSAWARMWMRRTGRRATRRCTWR